MRTAILLSLSPPSNPHKKKELANATPDKATGPNPRTKEPVVCAVVVGVGNRVSRESAPKKWKSMTDIGQSNPTVPPTTAFPLAALPDGRPARKAL